MSQNLTAVTEMAAKKTAADFTVWICQCLSAYLLHCYTAWHIIYCMAHYVGNHSWGMSTTTSTENGHSISQCPETWYTLPSVHYTVNTEIVQMCFYRAACNADAV